MRALLPLLLVSVLLPAVASAAEIELAPMQVIDWKAVQATVETRDRLPARARIGGTLTGVRVAEGDRVAAGQVVAVVVDEKLDIQLSAIDAQTETLQAQLANATTELQRGEDLLARGVTTAQRLDALRTQVEVLQGQIAATGAQRRVIEQQASEGAVLAPADGRVLDVPLAAGAVVMPGEAVALIGSGGTFLRLAIPERHAAGLAEGDPILIEGPDGEAEGRLSRLYPLIGNGRVQADVEVAGLPDRFVSARVLVRLPVARRQTLMVPADAVITRNGLDFVAVRGAGDVALRAVVPGTVQPGATPLVEILSGLQAGDVVVTDHE